MSHSDPTPPLPIDRRNRADLVCYYFSQGKSIPAILEILRTRHGMTDLTRDIPYHDLALATSRGWLTYNPDPNIGLSNRLRERYHFLKEVIVPSAGERMSSVTEAAEVICRSIEARARRRARALAKDWEFKTERTPFGSSPAEEVPVPMEVEVRIGVSGGFAVSSTTTQLGRRLGWEIEAWERTLKDEVFDEIERIGGPRRNLDPLIRRRFHVKIKLTFFALVSGFDSRPKTHPIAFLTGAMLIDEPLVSRCEVVCFNAPPFVAVGTRIAVFKNIDALRVVRERYEERGVDIILTSAGNISDEHSTFSRYYPNTRARQILAENGVRGDFLWLPLTATKPFSFKDLRSRLRDGDRQLLKYRPMTLIDLNDIADHVAAGRDLVLAIAPCGRCFQEKSTVLKAILGQERQIVTHLVVDRHSAMATLGEEDGER